MIKVEKSHGKPRGSTFMTHANAERKVQKIIDLHAFANQLPDHFSDSKTMTKSHVPARNAPERVAIPKLTNGTPAPVQRPKRT